MSGAAVAIGAAALSSGVCTALAVPVLHRLDVLDVPNARSTHDQPVVRGAGIGPLVAGLIVLVVAAAVAGADRSSVLALGGAVAVLGALGMADDLTGGLPIRVRLGGQLAVGAAVGVVVVSDTGPATVAVALACAVWVASAVNAFNFMDGINGITAVTAAVVGVTFGVIGAFDSTSALVLVGGLVVAGISLGFLPFNFPTARVFLGDVGSYFIGGWCAVLAVVALDAGAPLDAVAFPFALYLADTGTVLLGRATRGERLGDPHRQHAYQRLVDSGVPVARVTLFVGLCTAALATLGLLPWMAGPSRVLTIPAAAVVLGGYLLSAHVVSRRMVPVR